MLLPPCYVAARRCRFSPFRRHMLDMPCHDFAFTLLLSLFLLRMLLSVEGCCCAAFLRDAYGYDTRCYDIILLMMAIRDAACHARCLYADALLLCYDISLPLYMPLLMPFFAIIDTLLRSACRITPPCYFHYAAMPLDIFASFTMLPLMPLPLLPMLPCFTPYMIIVAAAAAFVAYC